MQQQPVSQCRDSVSKGLRSSRPSIRRCSRVAATSSIWRIRDARIGFSLRPFRVSSKDFVPRLRETREIHPACKTLFPSTRMTNAREKGAAPVVTQHVLRDPISDMISPITIGLLLLLLLFLLPRRFHEENRASSVTHDSRLLELGIKTVL